MGEHADVMSIGAGLAASEIVAAGKPVAVLARKSKASLGGQAFWSLRARSSTIESESGFNGAVYVIASVSRSDPGAA